jgi:hypothetical protein
VREVRCEGKATELSELVVEEEEAKMVPKFFLGRLSGL